MSIVPLIDYVYLLNSNIKTPSIILHIHIQDVLRNIQGCPDTSYKTPHP